MTTERDVVRDGVVALVKSVIVVAGVPVAIERLWFAHATPSWWIRLVLLVVGLLWALTAINLCRDVVLAVRKVDDTGPTGWSASWASAIAGLLLLAFAGSLVAQRSASPTAITEHATLAPNPAAGEQTVHCIVAPGECLADIAARELGTPEDWPLIAALNMGRTNPDGTRFVDANRLRAGWQLTVPEHSPSAVDSARVAPPGDLAGHGHRPSPVLPDLAIVGLGVLSTAALARRVRLLRRINESLRHPGDRLPAPESIPASVERVVGPLADGLLLPLIDVTNRLLTRVSTEEEIDPELRLLRAGPDGVEVFFVHAQPDAPFPFRSVGSGRSWMLDAHHDLPELQRLAGSAARRSPLLLPIGDDEHSSYLLALGRGRSLGVHGQPAAVDATLAGLLIALRTLPWPEEADVELLGLPLPPLIEPCFHLHESSTASLVDLANGSPTPQSEGPIWPREQLIMVGRDAMDDSVRGLLAGLAEGSGLIAPAFAGTENLVLRDGGAVLEPFGIVLVPVTPDARQLASITEVLRSAAAPPQLDAERVVPQPATRRTTVERGAIEICLLTAHPAIEGLTVDLPERDAGRIVELLSYLALHGNRATAHALAESMLRAPDGQIAAGLIRRWISLAQRALGSADDGRRRLEFTADEATLDQSVSCDWLRFRALVTVAQFAVPGDAVAALRRALSLVGRRTSGAVQPGPSWFQASGLAARITSAVVDAAHQLAQLAVASGDAELAGWAIDIGSCYEPASEMLARDQMVVAESLGDLSRVERVFGELETALSELGGNEPSEESCSLYRSLVGTSERSWPNV